MTTAAAPSHPGVGEREGYLGGSDAAAILSLSPYSTPFQVFAQKKGIEVPRSIDPVRDEKFEFGHAMEPIIAEAFAKRYKLPVRRTTESFYRGAVRSFMGAHLDFELADDSRVIVECKNIEFQSAEWGVPESLDQDSSALVPLYYLAQVDHYLDIRDAPYAYLVALFGGCKLRAYRINRDPEREKYLLEAERIFWDRVERDDPPPFSGADDLLSALASGYIKSYDATRAKKEKAVIQLDAVSSLLVSAVEGERIKQRRAKERADIARDALLQHLNGKTGYLYVGNEKHGSFLVQDREHFDDEGLKLAYPDIHAKFVRKAITGPVLRLTKDRAAQEAGAHAVAPIDDTSYD